MGCPYDVFPDHVELGEDIPAHVRGFNRGCLRDGKPWDGVTIYREGQRWRRLIIEEVRQRPEWIRAWRAARELDRRIEELCQRKGLRFAPHETPPWWAPDEMPERAPGESPRTSAWDTTLPQAVKLRQQLKAEIEAEDAGNPRDIARLTRT
jgi:hypothetical protein